MTGKDIYEHALVLAGYTDGAGGLPESPRFAPRALAALNDTYADLAFLRGEKDFTPLSDMTESVELPPYETLCVMPYGVAAALARFLGDSEIFRHFDSEYKLRRASVPENGRVKNEMP